MKATEPLVALIAGFVSFLAPCVLPLVPGYLSTVGWTRSSPGTRTER